MKNKQSGKRRVLTFGASWCGGEACSSSRIRLLTTCSALAGAWGETGSGTDLFLEADGGTSGWPCVAVLSTWPETGSSRSDVVSSFRFSSAETYGKERRIIKHEYMGKGGYTKKRIESNQGMRQPTCNPSWFEEEGLRRFRGLRMALFFTFLTADLGARGATGPEDSPLLEADLEEVG